MRIFILLCLLVSMREGIRLIKKISDHSKKIEV